MLCYGASVTSPAATTSRWSGRQAGSGFEDAATKLRFSISRGQLKVIVYQMSAIIIKSGRAKSPAGAED